MKVGEFIGYLSPIGLLGFVVFFIWILVQGFMNTFSLLNHTTFMLYIALVISWVWIKITSNYVHLASLHSQNTGNTHNSNKQKESENDN